MHFLLNFRWLMHFTSVIDLHCSLSLETQRSNLLWHFYLDKGSYIFQTFQTWSCTSDAHYIDYRRNTELFFCTDMYFEEDFKRWMYLARCFHFKLVKNTALFLDVIHFNRGSFWWLVVRRVLSFRAFEKDATPPWFVCVMKYFLVTY